MEFLARQFVAPKSVENYVSGASLLLTFLSRDVSVFNSFQVSLMHRAVKLTIIHVSNQKVAISMQLFAKIVQLSGILDLVGKVFKVAVLFSTFGLPRQSNLALSSVNCFHPTRDILRSDIRVLDRGLLMQLRWQKNHSTDAPTAVFLPKIPGSVLCHFSCYESAYACYSSSPVSFACYVKS